MSPDLFLCHATSALLGNERELRPPLHCQRIGHYATRQLNDGGQVHWLNQKAIHAGSSVEYIDWSEMTSLSIQSVRPSNKNVRFLDVNYGRIWAKRKIVFGVTAA